MSGFICYENMLKIIGIVEGNRGRQSFRNTLYIRENRPIFAFFDETKTNTKKFINFYERTTNYLSLKKKIVKKKFFLPIL